MRGGHSAFWQKKRQVRSSSRTAQPIETQICSQANVVRMNRLRGSKRVP